MTAYPPAGERSSGSSAAAVAGVALGATAVGAAIGAAIGPRPGASFLVAGLLLMSVLVAGAYLVWNVSPAFTLTAGVVLAPLSGNWERLGIPGALGPDRYLIVGGIAAVLAKVLTGRARLDLRPVHALLAAASAWAIASAALVGTLWENGPLFRLLEAYGILPFLVFTVAPIAFQTARERQVLLTGLVGLGGYLGLTSLFEALNAGPLIVPSYIDDPAAGIHYGRSRGPFTEAVANGLALYACAIAAAVAVAQWKRPAPRNVAVAVCSLCMLGTLLTLQRSVWLGVVLGTAAAFAAAPHLRRLLPRAIAAGIILLAITLAAIPSLADEITARGNDDRTVWERQDLNRAALNMVEERPLVGFGWGSLADLHKSFYEQSPDRPMIATGAPLHNVALTYAAELGLVGILLWGGAVLLAVAGAVRRRGPPGTDAWRQGLVALFVAWIAIISFVPPWSFTNLIFWTWAGAVWGAVRQPPGAR